LTSASTIAETEDIIHNLNVKIGDKNKEIAVNSILLDKVNSSIRLIAIALKFTKRDIAREFLSTAHVVLESVTKLIHEWEAIYFSTTNTKQMDTVRLNASISGITSQFKDSETALTLLVTILSEELRVNNFSTVDETTLKANGYLNTAIENLQGVHSLLVSLIASTTITRKISSNISILQDYISILSTEKANFTDDEFKDLQTFIHENTYTNDNIITTDIMTDAEILTETQSLYNQASKLLSRISTPTYTVSGNFINILELEEFDDYIEKLTLGELVTISLDDNSISASMIDVALLEIEYTYDKPEEFNLVFNSKFKLDKFKFTDLFIDIIGKGGGGTIGGTNTNKLTSTLPSINTTPSKDLGGEDIINTDNTVVTDGYISFGAPPPTIYGNNVGTWLGYDGKARLSLYSSETDFFQWDGSKILIKAKNFTLDSAGNITATSASLSGKISAGEGDIAGWTINTSSLNSGSIIFNSASPAILMGKTTSYLIGDGIFLGKDSDDDLYKMRIGNPSGENLSWNGEKLNVEGYLTSTDFPFDLELMKIQFQSISWAQFAIFDDFSGETKREDPDSSTYDARVYYGWVDNGGDDTADKAFGFVSKTYTDITTVYSGTSTSVGVNFLIDTSAVWFEDQYLGYLLKDSGDNEFEISAINSSTSSIIVSGTPASGAYEIISDLPTTLVAFCSFSDSSNDGYGYIKLEVSFDDGSNWQTILDIENTINNIGGALTLNDPGRAYKFRITLKNDGDGKGAIVYKTLICTDPSVWQ